ncbi:MAG: S1C family serine protease, partial [Halioglobus sp.]|nr:S1C family serine protease [Halioglobus sp.]
MKTDHAGHVTRRYPAVARLVALLFMCIAAFAVDTQAREVDYLSFATDDEANTTEVFDKASPAVVYVTNTALQRSLFSLDVREIPRGSGTGFVWDRQGLIVTNFHVIAGAHRLKVTLSDRSEH